MDRREFLKTAGAVTASVGVMGMAKSSLFAADAGKGAPHAKKLGWRLGCQAWTFNNTTFFDAIDNTAALGLHYIEGFPNQRVSQQLASQHMGPGLSADARQEVKKRLADKGIKLVNFGVGPTNKQAFDFARDMGIETLVSEPGFNDFDELDKLCDEYQINVAIHDHPKPSRYWNPEIVLEHVKGHNKRIGACCDTGHWVRSGINPIEALKKLEGRIISFHLKDLNEFSPNAHDVPWGTGISNVKGMLEEVHRQGIKPVFSIEYEYHYGHAMPELAECVAYFDKVCSELAGS